MRPAQFIHPNSHHLMREFFEVVKAGGRYHCQAIDVRKDGTQFNVEVYGIAFVYRGEPHVLGLVRDITEQVKAYELLEQRVEERTREMSMLLDVSNNMTSTLEIEKLLSLILDQLKYVADYDDAAIVVKEESRILILNAKLTRVPDLVQTGSESPFQNLGVIWDRLASGEAVVIGDVCGEGEMAMAFQKAAGESLQTTFHYIRSWLGVPLKQKESVVGFVSLTHTEPDYYGPQHVKLMTAIANQAAIAIENASLYAKAYATGRETAALAQTVAQVAFGGSLDVTLNSVCRQVVDAAGALACAVVLHDYEKDLDQIQGSHGLPEGYVQALNEVMAAGTRLIMQDAFTSRQHMVRRKMREIILERPEYSPIHAYMHTVPWDTVVAMPMVYRSRAVGVLLSYHASTREIGAADISFHGVMADQAAVAVENARLLVQEHDKARLEERQRLARELHDSVTQALFSISLVARSTEVLMERDGKHTGEVMGNMADLRQLTQGALAEMRALIFELRPGALEEEGLFEAIRKHAAATQSRVMMDVEVRKNVELLPRLKPAAEEGLYRIAQEALHNIVKHAKAKKATVYMEVKERWVTLTVGDDGVGFDPEEVAAGHMGLGTMGQRAEQLGGEYEVRSRVGEGTTVRVRIPLQRWLV
jgi:signal transduction histidine kinase